MKKIAVFMITCFLMTVGSTAYAHPPSDMIITFDPATKILKAVIIHSVSNPQNHYIGTVNVVLNGKEIIKHLISRQDNNATQTVSYLIPDVKAGDTLSVEGNCSISGELKKEIKTGP